jgi:hypothetical protein
LDEVSRRKDFDPSRPHRLGRAGVDAGDVGNRTERRVLHREALHAGQEPVQAGVELLTARVHNSLTWKLVEIVTLDRMDETAWRSVGRYEVIPATHVTPVGQAGQPCGDRIGAVKVVEQPAVEAFGAKRRLNGGHIERHDVMSINAVGGDLTRTSAGWP